MAMPRDAMRRRASRPSLQTAMFGPDKEQDGPYLPDLETVAIEPVFIIGPHRSGTTILYKALMESGCFNVTTVYHILNRHRLLTLHGQGREPEARRELQRLFHRRNAKNREYDRIEVNPDTPEEYAYALRHQWRRPTLKPNNLQVFVRFCKKVQRVQLQGHPLLLKNPFDTGNFMFMREAFPQARFVFIFRNPVEVINSQLQAIRMIVERKVSYDAIVSLRYRRSLQSPLRSTLARWACSDRIPLLYFQVSWNLARQCDYIVKNFDALAPCAVGITYRELCEAPEMTVSRVLSFFSLHPQNAADYRRLMRPRYPELLPEVRKRRVAIARRNKTFCERFGV